MGEEKEDLRATLVFKETLSALTDTEILRSAIGISECLPPTV